MLSTHRPPHAVRAVLTLLALAASLVTLAGCEALGLASEPADLVPGEIIVPERIEARAAELALAALDPARD